jgi:hypothetical protein
VAPLVRTGGSRHTGLAALPHRNIHMLRIDCWKAEKNLKTTYGSECALTSLAVDEPLEYARLYLEGNLQMWVDAEDSLEL